MMTVKRCVRVCVVKNQRKKQILPVVVCRLNTPFNPFKIPNRIFNTSVTLYNQLTTVPNYADENTHTLSHTKPHQAQFIFIYLYNKLCNSTINEYTKRCLQ